MMNFPLKPIEKYNDKENDYRNKRCREKFGSMNTDLKFLTNRQYLEASKELADDNIILSPVECIYYGLFTDDATKYYEVMSILLKSNPIKKNYLDSEWGIGTNGDCFKKLCDILK